MNASQLPDEDMQATLAALARSFERAREIARQTGTPLLIEIDGVFEEVDPEDPRLDRVKPSSSDDVVHDR
ncbi:MAG: hypothetical protein WA208_12970 [Thermoanaerobaculia bacterium]